jgi:agmatinase
MITNTAHLDQLEPGMVVVAGIPLDENSSFMRGARMAPALIQQALHSGSSNLSTEKGPDLSASSRWQDLGDLEFASGKEAFAQIEGALDQLLTHNVRVLSLGGDHSITYPILRAYSRKYPGLAILQLDAHSDLYEEFDSNRYSHACPFARIMEEHLSSRLVQVGIRAMTLHLREQAARFGVEVIEISEWQPGMVFEFAVPLYLSLDMDVLDPAFAPGISHYEPGGFSTRQVLSIIQGVKANLVGADIVEFNPTRDPSGVTAMVAAKFYKEIVARLLQ